MYSGASMTRVMIADGRSRVRFALTVLLGRQSQIYLVGEAVDAEDLISQAEEARPELILVDWGLPGLQGEASLRAIRQACPGVKLVVLSGQPEVEAEAMQAGADAFVDKTENAVYLLSALDSCCAESNDTEPRDGEAR